MNYQQIKSLQKMYGYDEIQHQIDTGLVWKLEGSAGRQAMSLLECGACMLPKESHRDYYGNQVPSRDMLKAGTKGTYQNALNFWSRVDLGKYF